MKKTISLVMAMAMALCFAGCNNSTSAPASTTAAPAAVTTAPAQTEAPKTEADNTEAEQTEANAGDIATEPVTVTVSGIDYVDEETGYAYSVATNYGTAYSMVETYSSADGITLTSLNRIYVPKDIATLEEILEIENGSDFADRFEECDFSGVKSWCFTDDAAKSAAAAYADNPYTNIYIQLKYSELTAAGKTDEEATSEINAVLEAAGFAVQDER